ncbi:hypothetical protein BDP27DRAFT_1368035 [Rhodocollybia butyracea]|uniref:Uncharacterized protein n=1 Tax=Rhodocollybia butyracea TaxID=206335 RepID=A0A9P5PD22_9AGAR|nr:hypothetical protein BDP27DRAFT_1368035 [Rhodocollybia butyracea]
MSIPHLEPSILKSCKNASLSPAKCTVYCGQFFPESGDFTNISPTTKCAICGCLAASHIHIPMHSENNGGSPKLGLKAERPYPASSATADAMFSSRAGLKPSSNAFSASPFCDHTKSREEQSAKEPESSNSTSKCWAVTTGHKSSHFAWMTFNCAELDALKKLTQWTDGAERHYWVYAGYADATKSTRKWFDRLKKGAPHGVYFEQLRDLIKDDIVEPAQELIQLSLTIASWTQVEKDKFNVLFSLGPFGLNLIVTCIEMFLQEAASAGKSFGEKLACECPDILTSFRSLPTALLSLNGSRHSVFSYDLESVDLDNFSAYDIREALIQAFGSITEPAKIISSALCGGAFGLHGFYQRFAEHVLDRMGTNCQEYEKIYQLLACLCQALAHRLISHAASLPGTAKPDARSAGRPSKRTPPTRSSSPLPSETMASTSGSADSPSNKPIPSHVAAAEAFAARVSLFTWENFVRDLLRDFPHPKLSKRLDHAVIHGLPAARQYCQLNLAYHPDQNIGEPAEWRSIALVLTQAIGAARGRL